MVNKKKSVKKERSPNRKGAITIKRKFLNNKSRKGWYYYIKEFKKRPSYYKIKQGVDIENYLLAYQGKVKSKKKGVLQYSKESPAKKYLKKVEKSKKIDDLISKGITETSLGNLRGATKPQINNAYRKMLEPLVKDKKLIEILSLEENVKKFKHRIQASINIVSSDGAVQINLKTFNKDVAEITNDFRNIVKKTDIMEGDLNGLLKRGYQMDGIPKGVNITGSKFHIIARKLGKINLRLRFVKGK